jgi:hypothetical protein
MTFKLTKKSSGPALMVYHVMNGAGAIVGSINIRPDEEKDLLRYWRADASPTAKPKVAPLKLPRLSPQALLRS